MVAFSLMIASTVPMPPKCARPAMVTIATFGAAIRASGEISPG